MSRGQKKEPITFQSRSVWEKIDLSYVLRECTEEEAFYMKYLYAGMSYSDMADYSAELFLKFVRHALMVRNCTPWGSSIDDATFLNYVLQYRVNNEHVEFYAKDFFEEIYPRIKDRSMYDAAVEVNFWAYEKATYHSTDDRTASPFTVIKNAYGRCGEESTLVTAALRSVGIPARQVYAPRWSHCDDNHAWVEVWIDGVWHFLGACEPEIELDRGWFVLAASRAAMVHTRAFSRMIEEDEKTTLISHDEKTTRLNVLAHYAEVKQIDVTVLDSSGAPKEGATVQFQVINYSELYTVAELKTNRFGKVSFATSKGTIVLFVYDKTGYSMEMVDLRIRDQITIYLAGTKENECSFTFIPAVGGEKTQRSLTAEEQIQQQHRIDKSRAIRQKTEQTFFTEEQANKYAQIYIQKYASDLSIEEQSIWKSKIETIVYNSRGNRKEIQQFLEERSSNLSINDKINLLSSIRKKDLTDISCECLVEHLREALLWKDRYEEDIFVSYLLCPRISDEMITSYRAEIRRLFSEREISDIQSNPQLIGEWIQEKIQICPDSTYSNLYTSPAGAVRIGVASERSRQILAVAMLRSLGIAGKIELSSDEAMYWNGETWYYVFHKAAKKKFGELWLTDKNGQNLQYYRDFTVAIQHDNHYKTLNLSETRWKEGTGKYRLEQGIYRITTTDRQLGGICRVKIFYTSVTENSVTNKTIDCFREAAVKKSMPMQDVVLKQENGMDINLKQCFHHKAGVAAWIEVGTEPTEHLLNEMVEAKEGYQKISVVLIVASKESYSDITLTNAKKAIPNLMILIQQSAPEKQIYEQFQLPEKALPLVIVLDEAGSIMNACAGYNVGTAELALKQLNK